MHDKKPNSVLLIISTVVISFAAIALMPTIINSVSRKIYKLQNDASNINFEDMGPELVKKDVSDAMSEKD